MPTKENNVVKEVMATGSSLSVKRNDFINTLTKFSLMEYRLFNYVAAAIRNKVTQKFIESKQDYVTKIRISDINNIFQTENKRQYEIFKAMAERLQVKIVKIPTSDGAIATVGIFKKQKYYASEGIIYIEIDVDLLPYIVNLNKEFVQVSLNQARQFGSINTWRLFEIIKQWEKTGSREFDIDDLKIKIGVEGKYPKISNFEQRVLKPCVEQINEKTTLKVSYKKIKTGRRVTSIKFLIGKTLYKHEVRQEVAKTKEIQAANDKVLAQNAIKKAAWDSMDAIEKNMNYSGSSGYIKFMAEFAKNNPE